MVPTNEQTIVYAYRMVRLFWTTITPTKGGWTTVST